MLINVKQGFVVFLTPKCASNSIETMIEPYCDATLGGIPALRHTDYRAYSRFLKPYLAEIAGRADLETICVVREPISWLNSHYRFRSRLEIRNARRSKGNDSTYGISFAQFIEAYISGDPPPYARFRSQFDFVRTDTGAVGIDTIFLYEEIERFFQYMSEKLNRRLGSAYKNVSPQQGGEKNVAAWIDYVRRKVRGRFGWGGSVDEPKVEATLPHDLLAALKAFMPDDFKLYDDVKSRSARRELTYSTE